MSQIAVSTFSWRAVGIASVVAGTIFLIVNALLFPPNFDLNFNLLLRYMASLVLGPSVLIGTSSLTTIVGLAVHYALSFVFTLIIAVVVYRWGLIIGMVGGAVLGLALYLLNLYTFTIIFPWFFAIDNRVLILSHIMFGAVAGGLYELMDQYDTPIEMEISA